MLLFHVGTIPLRSIYQTGYYKNFVFAIPEIGIFQVLMSIWTRLELNSGFRSARVGPNGASYSTEFADSEPQTGESGVGCSGNAGAEGEVADQCNSLKGAGRFRPRSETIEEKLECGKDGIWMVAGVV
jgi:hypothetical protein